MTRVLLLPGDFVCDLLGFPTESDHRQILRSFFNMMIWSALCIAAMLKIAF